MKNLSIERPLFHSEADFQHALAWEIQKHCEASNIRLEYKFPESNIYLDIWVQEQSKSLAIELKYCTAEFKIESDQELFYLKNHSARDIRRYDFVKDLERLEKIVLQDSSITGLAIFLTNDSGYWRNPKKEKETLDKNFRIHDDKIISGTLLWKDGAAVGTIKNREAPIKLRHCYHIKWQDYSSLQSQDKISKKKSSRFRYTILRVIK